MTQYLHRLDGCGPVPLAGYLKALGVLRLLVEQGADPQARGWWQSERFCILSTLNRQELENFFLCQYEPTPLLSPWNKGCGFFQADDAGMAPLERSTARRFQEFRRSIAATRTILDAQAAADGWIRAIKNRTKTNKSFQKPEEREALAASPVFGAILEKAAAQLNAVDLPQYKREELNESLAIWQQMVAPVEQPPGRAEAERLAASPAYRQLLAAADRNFKQHKDKLIPNCHRRWRGPVSDWFSVAVVLDESGTAQYPSLLGTGGNDGRLDFTNNFMQRLGEIFHLDSPQGHCSPLAPALLRHSLWAEPVNGLRPSAIGQYDPGAAGGPNSTTGSMGDSLVNSWDFILMMEGALLLRARATRHLDPVAASRASAPFAVRPHAAGFSSAGLEKSARGEQWLPLWSRPAGLSDVAAVFAEGRLQLGRLTANRPVDAARALSRLGTARGIDSFERYGYLERNGQSTLAVPLGRIHVRHHPRAHLIDDLAPWLEKLRRLANGKNATARLQHAEKVLAGSVFSALTHDYSPERWQAILLAAAAIETLQQSGSAFEAGPIPPLSPEWVPVLGNTPVVRLAAALGSAAAAYSPRGRAIDPVRHHWLPLEPGARRFRISDRRLAADTRVVMHARDAALDCAQLVQRRSVEAQQSGQRNLPLVAAHGAAAKLTDLRALLTGSLPLDLIVSLAQALMSVRWDQWNSKHHLPSPPSRDLPDEAWLALRLASLPWSLRGGCPIPAEASLCRRLLGGDSAGAIQLALQRLTSSGLRPPLRAGAIAAPQARLWAAALAFPIDRRTASLAAVTLDPSLKG